MRLSCECCIRTAVALGSVHVLEEQQDGGCRVQDLGPVLEHGRRKGGRRGAKGNTSNAMSGEHIRPEPQSSGELLKLILKHVRNFNEICVCVSLRL